METKNTSLILESLESKVEKLIIKHNEAKVNIKNLRDENILLQEKLTQEKVQVKQLSEQNKVLKLAKSLTGKEGKSTDIKLKINQLIREIDKCIAQVNS
ncbi:MAG: hypothetical protein CMD18_06415 [Flavobacteriales bacterium]|nr:hypothetical protein [Flavobacteriales bacterium]